jgi:methionyl-tRNA formyltransferase
MKELGYDVNFGIVKKVPKKNDINKIIYDYYYLFSLKELISLGSIFIFYKVLNFFFKYGLLNYNFSVEGVCRKNKINFFNVYNNINKTKYIDIIKNINPNIILSSNSLIFGKDILNLDKTILINRHTSILPAYGGLWPVLYAINNDEDEIGVSIHLMTNKIDQGDVISQGYFRLNNSKNLYRIYKKAFQVSVDLVLQAISKSSNNKIVSITNSAVQSYNNMPQKSDIYLFKSKGGRLI